MPINSDVNKLVDRVTRSNDPIKEISQIMSDMRDALQAARMLCANLETGGTGHMSLVENFRKLDEKIN